MQTLMTNAKKEGQLQAIGIPPSWADYADILAGYTSNYGIPVSYKVEADYSSAEELGVFQPRNQAEDALLLRKPQVILKAYEVKA